jgi:cathepsin X
MRKRSYEKNCCSREMYLKGSVIAGLVGVVLGTEILFPGDKELGHVTSPLPFTYISERDLPKAFSWDNVNGISYLTKNLNQHIPQYCGSCWAHSSMSALSDRIKIARNASGLDINLSIQYILNCASEAGSCHGGSAIRAYQVLHDMGGIPVS